MKNNLRTPNIVSYHHPTLGKITTTIPVYPSAVLTVLSKDYMAALDLVPKGTPCIFCDGETIVIPEYEVELVDSIRVQFDATVKYGQLKEHEFATLAVRAGVDGHLIVLGDCLQAVLGSSPEEMVNFALRNPERARTSWSAEYDASMNPH